MGGKNTARQMALLTPSDCLTGVPREDEDLGASIPRRFHQTHVLFSRLQVAGKREPRNDTNLVKYRTAVHHPHTGGAAGVATKAKKLAYRHLHRTPGAAHKSALSRYTLRELPPLCQP